MVIVLIEINTHKVQKNTGIILFLIKLLFIIDLGNLIIPWLTLSPLIIDQQKNIENDTWIEGHELYVGSARYNISYNVASKPVPISKPFLVVILIGMRMNVMKQKQAINIKLW